MDKKSFFNDKSGLSIIVSNLIILITALIQEWEFVYFGFMFIIQGLIIGFFNMIKILNLKFIDKKTGEKKFYIFLNIFIAIFFIFHYGFFNLIIGIFILALNSIAKEEINFSYLIIPSLVFFINHGFSYIYNRKKDSEQNIGRLMFIPYLRILPMDFTIFFIFPLMFISGKIISFILIFFFLLIKTAVDFITHKIEHRIFQYKKIKRII